MLSSRMDAKTGFFPPRTVPKRANVVNEAFGAIAQQREGGVSWVSCRDTDIWGETPPLGMHLLSHLLKLMG